jgi:antitoxin MazE
MKTRIQKWGNSLALRIPTAFAKELGLEAEKPVELRLKDGTLVIENVEDVEYTLEDLLAQIDEHHLHGEIDTGSAFGNEEW